VVKQQILFLQGGGAGAHQADAKLVASLRRPLGTSYDVRFPKMPAEDDPDYQRWKPRLTKELAALGNGSILVGHSVGGSFLLKYLVEEEVTRSLAGIFLIATPFWGGAGWRYEGFERVALPSDFGTLLPPGAPIFLYHGRDDETVPFAHLSLYAAKLPHATLRAIEGRGHQLGDDLSEVAADIRSLPA
jgi:predicted alpha/beta hydrolase family esterase